MARKTVDTETGEIRYVRPFADVLRELRRGAAHDEIGETLADVVEAVEQSGKAGKLTITLTVKPFKAGQTVTIADDIKASLPKDQDETLMFIDGANLTREDPQQKLPIGPRAIETPPASEESAQ